MRTLATGGLLVAGHAAGLALAVVGQLWAAALVVLATHGFFLLGTLVPNSTLFGPVVSSFRTSERELWLTIDDGLDPRTTPDILDRLRQSNAKATFFAIGDKRAAHPELAARVLEEGHQIGNHSQTHPHRSFWAIMPWRLSSELGDDVACFRSPVGMSNWFVHRYLARRGARPIGWTARGLDGLAAERAVVLERLRRGIRPGAILVIHEGYDPQRRGYSPADIVGDLLDELDRRGFRCVVPSCDRLQNELPTQQLSPRIGADERAGTRG